MQFDEDIKRGFVILYPYDELISRVGAAGQS